MLGRTTGLVLAAAMVAAFPAAAQDEAEDDIEFRYYTEEGLVDVVDLERALEKGDVEEAWRRSDLRVGAIEEDFEGWVEDVWRTRETFDRRLHTLVELRDATGARRIVDLGARIDPVRMGLERGDLIRVRIQPVTIRGESVLLARRLGIARQTTDIAWDLPELRPIAGDLEREGLRGRIVGLRWIRFEGQPEAHAVLWIRTREGRTVPVDLGPRFEVTDLALDEDAPVVVRGSRGTIDGRVAVLARRLDVGGREIHLRTLATRWHPERVRVDGVLVDVEPVRVSREDPARAQHNVVQLRFAGGRTVLVDLGPGVDALEAGLRPGARVVLQGESGSVEGRPAMSATWVRSDGETVWIDPFAPLPEARAVARDRTEAEGPGILILDGEIVGWRSAEMAGGEDPHLLVIARGTDGEEFVADLGPRVDAESVGLREGARIQVGGFQGTLDDRPAVFATLVRLDGRRTNVDFFEGRTPQALAELRIQPERPEAIGAGYERETLRGTIRSVRPADLDGQELLEIEFEDGETHLLNIAPDADLRPGDEIELRGSFREVGERRIFEVEGRGLGEER